MDLRSLKYFVSVYQQGSFSAAAKACFVAQPSMSFAIAQLEDSLQTTLFNRHARGVTATAYGERLFPLAQQLLGQADAISHLFVEKSLKQSFLLGVTKGLGVERMSALLKDFTASQEFMELTLVSHTQTCDARIIMKEEIEENEQFITIWKEDYLLALPYNHMLSLKDHITLSDLDALPFIQRTPCVAWNHLNDTLTLAGYSVDIRAKIQTIDYALGLVQAGLGCALVPAHSEILSKTELVYRPIEGLRLMREIVFAFKQATGVISQLQEVVIKHRR
ncbi:LysR family transcriptional regulator [Glaciecola sp. SC05]|uniref:LysR family transcriptional regulator n=1 Tax=Glaciecola sp. SC05 TaxID=1987355 RepID=UPI003527E3EF